MHNVGFEHLLILGMAIVGGLLGAGFFQKIRCPQVIGYIVIGLLVGESGFRLITTEEIAHLRLFNLFALGIIGFLVGGELKLESFKKYGRQFAAILMGEGLAAFVLVGIGVGWLTYVVSGSGSVALATGIVFGAIASATDPASTLDVLWESRSLGILTTSLTATVALDDALAMTLYGLGTGLAQVLTSHTGSVLSGLVAVWIELLGAVALGLLSGAILVLILRYVNQAERTLAFAIGLILLVIGTAVFANLDVILAAMSMGFVVGNRTPRKSEELFKITRAFAIPIYVLFFVLVGARLAIGHMPGWLWGLVAIYVIGRSVGKMGGAWLGARWTRSDPVVQKYLGMGLFAQGGVAIGLSIMAGQHLGNIRVTDDLSLGDTIIFGVAATTLIVQLLGPPMVKLAVKLSGEGGRNITREDIIAELKAQDVMDDTGEYILDSETLTHVVQRFTQRDSLYYPVVDAQGHLIGGLSLNMLKDVLADQATWNWLCASDVMRSVAHQVYPSTALEDVLTEMDRLCLQYLPVVRTDDQKRPIGVIALSNVQHRINREILKRRQTS